MPLSSQPLELDRPPLPIPHTLPPVPQRVQQGEEAVVNREAEASDQERYRPAVRISTSHSDSPGLRPRGGTAKAPPRSLVNSGLEVAVSPVNPTSARLAPILLKQPVPMRAQQGSHITCMPGRTATITDGIHGAHEVKGGGAHPPPASQPAASRRTSRRETSTQLETNYQAKTQVLGPGKEQQGHIKVLDEVIDWDRLSGPRTGGRGPSGNYCRTAPIERSQASDHTRIQRRRANTAKWRGEFGRSGRHNVSGNCSEMQ